MVEGGSLTLSLFIELGLWDEARIFTSPKLFHSGIPAPSFQGRISSEEKIDSDFLRIYRPETHSKAHH